MTFLRRLTFATLIAPLALGLAACGDKGAAEGEAPEGEPIAAIAAPEGQDWADVVTVTPEGGYQIGNPQAPLKLIGYASLTCPHCAHFAEESGEKLHSQYVASGVVSFELRNQIHDGLDLTMSLLARCGAPESFHALSDQVWLNLDSIIDGAQKNQAAVSAAMKNEDQTTRYKSIADAAGLTEFFAARGISSDQAAMCLADPAKAEDVVKKSEEQTRELGVDGTPTFFLNGARLDAKTWADLEPALQNAGAR